MSIVTVEIPESLRQRIEELAASEGYSLGQFLATAAGEKLAVMLTMGYLQREAAAGNRAEFDRYMAAVPDGVPSASDRIG